jgi:fructose-1,6-bisphosphatase
MRPEDRKFINKPLKPAITDDGQAYVDEPVYIEVSKAKPLALEVNAALPQLAAGHIHVFGAKRQQPRRRGPHIPPVIETLSHYNHVRLRWMKPDGRGGLIPRET